MVRARLHGQRRVDGVWACSNSDSFPHRWLGHTLVGTTDAPSAAETRPTAPEDEVQWLLNECSRYLSPDARISAEIKFRDASRRVDSLVNCAQVRVSRKDVLSAWRGWRPLARDPHVSSGVRTKRPRRPARPQQFARAGGARRTRFS